MFLIAKIKQRNQKRFKPRFSGGFSLMELLIAIVIVAILLIVAGLYYQRALAASYEARAVGNMQAIISAESAFYGSRKRFGTFQQLINEFQLLGEGFERKAAGTEASEVITDGQYEYSLRFDSEATGYTLDADPKPAYVRQFRRFRYRFREIKTGRCGIILVSPPSAKSPPDYAYSVLGN